MSIIRDATMAAITRRPQPPRFISGSGARPERGNSRAETSIDY
jgi:hypothetical protein